MTVSQSQAVESFLSGKLTQVDISGIERELRNLWMEASKDSERAVVRACSFNLVLMSTESGAQQKCSDMLDEVLAHHPGRAVLALFTAEQPRKIEAWVSARCHLQGTTKQICSEQITVAAQGAEPQSLTSVVLPLLIPDLPVYMWWRSEDLNADLLRSMVACSRWVIIDSGLRPYEPEYLGSLLKAVSGGATPATCAHIHDLNWRRLEGWMRSLGNAFDGFPMEMECLFQIEKLTIECAGDSAAKPSSQALWLLSWISSRLGWTPGKAAFKDGAWQFDFTTRDKKKVDARCTTGKSDLAESGSVINMGCKFSDGAELKASLEKHDDKRFITASVVGKENEVEREALESGLNEITLVGRAVEYMAPDPVFEETVTMVTKLIALVG